MTVTLEVTQHLAPVALVGILDLTICNRNPGTEFHLKSFTLCSGMIAGGRLVTICILLVLVRSVCGGPAAAFATPVVLDAIKHLGFGFIVTWGSSLGVFLGVGSLILLSSSSTLITSSSSTASTEPSTLTPGAISILLGVSLCLWAVTFKVTCLATLETGDLRHVSRSPVLTFDGRIAHLGQVVCLSSGEA